MPVRPKTFLDKMVQLARLTNEADRKAFGWASIRKRSELSSADWMKTFQRLQDEVESQFSEGNGKNFPSFMKIRNNFVQGCREKNPADFFSGECSKKWDREWYNHVPNLPSVQDVNLDPLMYTEHPNPYVREYAIKLINGEIQ